MSLFSEVILHVLGQENEEAVHRMSEYEFICAPMDSHVDLPLLKENKQTVTLKSIDEKSYIACAYIFHIMSAVNVIYIKPILLYFYYRIYLRSAYTIQIRCFVFYNPGSLENLPVVTLLQNDWQMQCYTR